MNSLDSLGIEKSLNLFPDQVETTFDQGMNSNIEKLDFDSVVVSGMGGSSNAGKIIQSLIEPESSIPLTIYNDYGLPAWVNSNTLVVLNSYSGNTEETLSALNEAISKKAKIIAVTAGGKLKELTEKGEVKGVLFNAGDTNPSGYPKSGLGLSLGALIAALVKVGLLQTTKEELLKALDELIKVRETWDVQQKAEWLKDSLPVLFSSKAFLGPLNAGRNAMCEIGRVFTCYYDFPEVNHVLIEATQKPDLVKKAVKYLFFESQFDNERIKLRYKITKDIFKEQGLDFSNYVLQTSTRLSQALEIAHYCAWLGFHLSILRNEDPGPEPWIIKLKEALSQPVH